MKSQTWCSSPLTLTGLGLERGEIPSQLAERPNPNPTTVEQHVLF